MGNILFYDTETSGKFNFRIPPNHESQPQLMQFATVLTDPEGKALATFAALVKPHREYEVALEAKALHGLTYAMCDSYGVNPHALVLLLNEIIGDVTLIAAHNENFDNNIMQAFSYSLLDDSHTKVLEAVGNRDEFNSHISSLSKRFCGTPRYCTMKASTDICKIPGNYGKYKWPKLQEAYKHFFHKEFDNAHDALPDVIACKDVYFAITQHLS